MLAGARPMWGSVPTLASANLLQLSLLLLQGHGERSLYLHRPAWSVLQVFYKDTACQEYLTPKDDPWKGDDWHSYDLPNSILPAGSAAAHIMRMAQWT
jgi:hypothetical protein